MQHGSNPGSTPTALWTNTVSLRVPTVLNRSSTLWNRVSTVMIRNEPCWTLLICVSTVLNHAWTVVNRVGTVVNHTIQYRAELCHKHGRPELTVSTPGWSVVAPWSSVALPGLKITRGSARIYTDNPVATTIPLRTAPVQLRFNPVLEIVPVHPGSFWHVKNCRGGSRFVQDHPGPPRHLYGFDHQFTQVHHGSWTVMNQYEPGALWDCSFSPNSKTCYERTPVNTVKPLRRGHLSIQ